MASKEINSLDTTLMATGLPYRNVLKHMKRYIRGGKGELWCHLFD